MGMTKLKVTQMTEKVTSANRKPFVAGNWKMNNTAAEAAALAKNLTRLLVNIKGVDVVLCPPFTSLAAVGGIISGTNIGLGAQNMHWEKSGAFTGEVSAAMLRDLYCHYVIIGHSERRALFGETDEIVNHKVKAALEGNLHPIVCIGETIEQRKSGKTEDIIKKQLQTGLKELDAANFNNLIIAYEPVWAIGTGMTATPQQAQNVHLFIRRLIQDQTDEKTALSIRILYGGSVKPNNATELFSRPDIDGGLIGGASLEADSFVAIVNAALP
jgi:triosephosphate isomerase